MRVLITGGSGFIGTNLVNSFLEDGIEVLNLDCAPPLNVDDAHVWTRCSIMDRSRMGGIFQSFQPTHVVHLAARTDCDESTTVEEGYRENTDGTANVLAAIQAAPSAEHAIITSTQYVIGPQHRPRHEYDYAPHTVYGHSKVITEQLTRAAELDCAWTLIRPVNIWGPWHLRYRQEFLRVLRKGWYVHPGRAPVVRTYGYVGNVVWQIRQILDAPRESVDRRMLYVGDLPIDIHDWVNGFSECILGRRVRTVPRVVVRMLGWAGDLLVITGMKAPITSSRFKSMTQDYRAPTELTLAAFGKPPFALAEGILRTVIWLEQYESAQRAKTGTSVHHVSSVSSGSREPVGGARGGGKNA